MAVYLWLMHVAFLQWLLVANVLVLQRFLHLNGAYIRATRCPAKPEQVGELFSNGCVTRPEQEAALITYHPCGCPWF